MLLIMCVSINTNCYSGNSLVRLREIVFSPSSIVIGRDIYLKKKKRKVLMHYKKSIKT